MIIESKPKAYRLIKEYPGSKPLGYIEPYTTGELSKYPEHWQPIYDTNFDPEKRPHEDPFSENTEWVLIKEYPGSDMKGTIISCRPTYEVNKYYAKYPEFYKKVEPETVLFPTFCGMNVCRDPDFPTKSVIVGESAYSMEFFRNMASLLRLSKISVYFNNHLLSLDQVNDFVEAVENNK